MNQGKNPEQDYLEQEWQKEFARISRKTSLLTLILGGLLFPASAIDYFHLDPSEDIPLFLAVKFIPSVITAFCIPAVFLRLLPARVAMYIGALSVITACMYRPINFNSGDFLQINAVVTIVLSLIPFYPRKHAFLIAAYIFLGNVLAYFVFYTHVAPPTNAGLLVIAALAGVFTAVANFRYTTVRKNFINSLALKLKNEALETQKSDLLRLNEEINLQKEEISEQAEELREVGRVLRNKSDKLEQTYGILQKSAEILRLREENIQAGINYAARIQSVLLPDMARIKNHLPDSFIFLEPRDTVSGDFYWFGEIEQRSFSASVAEAVKSARRRLVLVAVDCTGHGVPGAFMSILGGNILAQIVNEQKISRSNLILAMMHEHVRRALKQKETKNQDGMEAAVCVIKPEEKEMDFSGARRPLVYFQNDELVLIKGDKNSIGGEVVGKKRQFKRHTLDYSEGLTFYVFSDGYQDQFGGPNDRKFMLSRLKKLMTEVHRLPAREQEEIFRNRLYEWENEAGEKRIDDVLLIGVRLSGDD